ncbi:MAG: lysylphosphatidylglycerol synthase transmembrane domain-containing protein [Thermodesulfovibrio sp.]|nr:flippase-like domain-containing protein [Thermodesulfovibrio sp.]MDW7998468.1 lysylphosphatidylglycerol synthase transmembrane domain-containing protein [Thermodesulfovibrio sp.]
MKQYIKFLIRLTITVLLIIYLFKKIDFSNVLRSIVLINPVVFFLASFLYILSSYISTLRWKIFLSERELKTSNLFSLYLIGSFFNNFLPGIIGGDIVKIFMLKEKTGLKQAFASVFMERYTGLAALLSIGLISFCLFYPKLPKNLLIWSVPASFALFLSGSILFLIFGRFKFFKLWRDYFFSFNIKQIFRAFLFSILIQLTVINSVYIIFTGLNLPISFFELVIFMPVIILISMLPISVSGIGVREWCFVLFFGSSTGNSNAIAVSFLWFLSQVFASLIGGIEYLRIKNFLNMKKE